jgi:hypothetical protein
MNVGMIKAFLAFKKRKENGKCSSHVQLRKYNDAIIWVAKTSHKRLPLSYYEEMDKFLVAFKKETTMAKKDGMLDAQEADPITWTLFRKILQWALDRNIFTCGYFRFSNGTAWHVPLTLASWLCIASVLGEIALSCGTINPRRTRQEKTSTSTTTHLIHWFQFFLPWGFGSVLNLLVLKIPSLCSKRYFTIDNKQN